jgi:hypothetical protein
MCRVSDEYYAATVPLVEFHPLNGAAVELLVARERIQILWDWSTKVRKALPYAF